MITQPQIVFLDFEASSLGKDGYPIEVAWVFESGEEESHLIKPEPSWTDWDEDAQATHHITRDQLLNEGTPVGEVAQRMIALLTGHALYATAPSWDGKWLSRLLRGAGLPRHALRLEDTEAAHRKAVFDVLCAGQVPVELHEDILHDVLRQAGRSDDEHGPAAHRALADARRELRLWLDVRRRAEEIASRLSSAAPKS